MLSLPKYLSRSGNQKLLWRERCFGKLSMTVFFMIHFTHPITH
jgi:hypothetical protein